MNSELWIPSAVVTALALVGFYRRPTSLYEILSPRFVAPAIFWLSSVANAIIREPMSLEKVEWAYERNAAAAMWFIAACMVVFWIGYFLPFGKWIGKSAPYLPVDLQKRSRAFLFGSIALLIAMHLGPLVIDFFGPLSRILAVFIRIGPFGSAMLVGLYLGAQKKLNAGHFFLLFIVLVAAMFPLMSRFSRGTGLPIFIATISFCYMRREIKALPVLFALLATVYFGVQGLRGRGVHGHYGGVQAYVTFLMESPLPLSGFAGGSRLVHDSLTPTSVAILANQEPSSFTRTLSKQDWLLNCIPVPRALGIPDYKFSLGSFIAGQPISWGYTPSIFGDTIHHLGWMGVIPFAVIGVYYRGLEQAAFRKFDGITYSSEWYSFLCLLSYYALLIAMYLNFRSWIVNCSLGIYGMVGLIFVKSILGGVSKPPIAAGYTYVVQKMPSRQAPPR